MLVLIYIINALAPAVNFLGMLGLCACVIEEDFYICAIGLAAAIVGLFFGLRACKLDIAPRWFWSKSRNNLFKFTVAKVFGYMVSVSMYPFAVYLVIYMCERCINV